MALGVAAEGAEVTDGAAEVPTEWVDVKDWVFVVAADPTLDCVAVPARDTLGLAAVVNTK